MDDPQNNVDLDFIEREFKVKSGALHPKAFGDGTYWPDVEDDPDVNLDYPDIQDCLLRYIITGGK